MDALGSFERPVKATITWTRTHEHGDPANVFTARVQIGISEEHVAEAQSRSLDAAVAYALQDLATLMLDRRKR